MLEHGLDGADRDPGAAREWYREAAAQLFEEAEEALERLRLCNPVETAAALQSMGLLRIADLGLLDAAERAECLATLKAAEVKLGDRCRVRLCSEQRVAAAAAAADATACRAAAAVGGPTTL